MTSRRGFLGILGAVAAAAAFDPERALWVPGAKTISIPAASENLFITPEEYVRIALKVLRENLRFQLDHNRIVSMQLELVAGGHTSNIRRPRRGRRFAR